MQLGVERPRSLGGEARHALQLLLRRGNEPLGGTVVLQDGPPPRRPDALERVEDRLERARVAAATVMRDRESVRLVAGPNGIEARKEPRVSSESAVGGTPAT